MTDDDPDGHPEPGASAEEGGPRVPPHLQVVGADAYGDWDEVYLDNVARIHRLMYAKVGNRPDAEDLTAEVFLAAFKPLRLSASRHEVRAYLLATARTVLAGYWRQRLGIEVTAIDADAERRLWDDQGGSGDAAQRQGAAGVERLLGKLPDRYRRILELRFLGAMSVKDAAKEMDVTVGNAKVLQYRALRLAAEVEMEDR